MRVAILGAGGHGRVLYDLLRAERAHEIVGWLDTLRPRGDYFLGAPILGKDLAPEIATEFGLEGVVVALGDNAARARAVQAIQQADPRIRFPSAIHPRATVAADVRLGQGVMIVAGAVVNTGAVIGDHCLVNTLASVDHECVLAPFASLAPRACLGGGVKIGEGTAICLGAMVVHRRQIGAHTVVGAGSLVLADLPDYVVAYGSPARVVRPRKPGDAYL